MRYEQLFESLERDGYVVVREVVPQRVVEELRQWIDALVDVELEERTRDVRRRMDAGEIDPGDVEAVGFSTFLFPDQWTYGQVKFRMDDEPRLDPLVENVQELKQAIGTSGRIAREQGINVYLPGCGGQEGLHPDVLGPVPGNVGHWDGGTFTWPLSAAPWRGMRLVPGSHRQQPEFRDRFVGSVAPHPDEVVIEAGPGDVIFTSNHIWKASTLNGFSERRVELWH